MCGICGFAGAPGDPERLRREVRAMSDSLRHRGPDDSNQWLDAEAGLALGHRRLSIIDLSPLGQQPMVSAGGRYVISYNGEVYNFAQLRRQLEEAGYPFRGDSDTEAMLAAIESWGLDQALERFVGMFAFALWDRAEGKLTLARDRLGIKPLYWGRSGESFFFASELKALRAFSAWTPAIDHDALAHYMRWNYVPGPKSIYRGVAKLMPGQILQHRPGGKTELRSWWNLQECIERGTAEPHAVSPEQATQELGELLSTAVGQRMVADVPLGAFLSGGIDSSIVVALMQQHSPGAVKTFTIGFDDSDYNEAEQAKAVAQHLGTDHTELYVTPEDALAVVPRLPEIYDEPFADSSQVPTFLISELTRRHVTVALSGDGGDELFAGYTRYFWADMVWRRFGWMPRPLRNALAGGIESVPAGFWESAAQLVPPSRRPPRVGERAHKFAQFLRQPDALSIYRQQHTHWTDPASLVLDGQEPGEPFREAALSGNFHDFIQRMQFLDAASYLPDDILTKVDRASMAVSLEARVPLLDHRVVEYVWRLPPALRARDGRGKWLLRHVLQQYLPRALIDRPKKGFSIPTGTWLRGPLRDWAEDLLSEERLRRDGLFDPQPIRRAWRELQAGKPWHEPIWGALMFQAWHDLQARTA